MHVGQRVSGEHGELLLRAPGRKRARRLRVYGEIIGVAGERLWEVRWDDGSTGTYKSGRLRVEPSGAMPPGTELVATPRDVAPGDAGEMSGGEDPTGQAPRGPWGWAWSALGLGVENGHGPEDSDSDESVPRSMIGEAEEHGIEVEVDDPSHVDATRHAKAVCIGEIGRTISVGGVDWTVVPHDTERAPSLPPDSVQNPLVDYTFDEQWTPLGIFLHLYPGELSVDVENINKFASDAQEPRWCELTMREYVVFIGLILAAVQFSESGVKKLWSETQTGFTAPACFGRYMPSRRFEAIKKFAGLCKADLQAREHDPWWKFRRWVTDFNKNRLTVVQPCMRYIMDESMSSWRPQKSKTGGLPHLSFIARKPEPLGTEFKCAAECRSGLLTWLEIQEGRARMTQLKGCSSLGATAACVYRCVEDTTVDSTTGPRTFLGDSWFASVKAAVATAQSGHHFVGHVKNAHASFPKAYLKETLGPLCGGTSLHLEGSVDGIRLVASGYKYSRKKVLFFVHTKGCHTSTAPGTPYMARFCDAMGNQCRRAVSRPQVVADYFRDSPRVDAHNQVRQFELALEKKWVTWDAYFRLWSTLIGINTVDAWKATRTGVGPSHPMGNTSIREFTNVLAQQCVTNDLGDSRIGSGYAAHNIGPRVRPSSRGPIQGDDVLRHELVSLGTQPTRPGSTHSHWRVQRICVYCSRVLREKRVTCFQCNVCQIALCRVPRECFAMHLKHGVPPTNAHRTGWPTSKVSEESPRTGNSLVAEAESGQVVSQNMSMIF